MPILFSVPFALFWGFIKKNEKKSGFLDLDQRQSFFMPA